MAAPDDPLAEHRWRSRVLAVFAPGPDDGRLAAQKRVVAAMEGGAKERDLVLLEFTATDPRDVALRSRLGAPREGFAAVLVGKDGGAKLVSSEPIGPSDLAGTIDAMPMRRREMRER